MRLRALPPDLKRLFRELDEGPKPQNARRKRNRPLCLATRRDGGQCNAHVIKGRMRCRMHGGLSTGPRTETGKAAIAASNRGRTAARRADP